MKKTVLVILVLILFIICSFSVYAESGYAQSIVDSSPIRQAIEALDDKSKDTLKSIGLNEINDSSVFSIDSTKLFDAVFESLKTSISEVKTSAFSMMAALFISAVFSASNEGLLKEKNTKVADICTSLFIAGVTLTGLMRYLVSTKSIITAAGGFCTVVIPSICVILSAQGRSFGATLGASAVSIISQLVSAVYVQVLLPICYILLGLGVASGVESEFNSHKILSFLRKYLVLSMSVCAGLYFSVLGIKTQIGTAADEAAIKALKLTAGSFIPVIGSSISESASTVVASLALSKTTIGAAGLFTLFSIFLPLLSKGMAWLLSFEINALVAGLLNLDAPKKLLNNLTGALSVLLIIIVFIALVMMIQVGMLSFGRTTV